MPTTIQLPAGTEWVTIRSIPEWFARALHGAPRESAEFTAHDMAWNGTIIEYEEVIKHAVMHGEIVPRNAMTQRPMPDARGQAMLNSIMSVDDLAEFAKQFVVGVSVAAAQTETKPAPEKAGARGTATEDEAALNQPHKKGTKWTDDELNNLLRDYKAGKTQEDLADFHGVKRQCISKVLQRADAKFVPKRDEMSMVAQAKRMVTFGNDK